MPQYLWQEIRSSLEERSLRHVANALLLRAYASYPDTTPPLDANKLVRASEIQFALYVGHESYTAGLVQLDVDRPFLRLNNRLLDGSGRLLIIHMLGHALLHPQGQWRRFHGSCLFQGMDSPQETVVTQDAEAEAEEFVAHALAPLDILEPIVSSCETTCARLAQLFRVPECYISAQIRTLWLS